MALAGGCLKTQGGGGGWRCAGGFRAGGGGWWPRLGLGGRWRRACKVIFFLAARAGGDAKRDGRTRKAHETRQRPMNRRQPSAKCNFLPLLGGLCPLAAGRQISAISSGLFLAADGEKEQLFGGSWLCLLIRAAATAAATPKKARPEGATTGRRRRKDVWGDCLVPGDGDGKELGEVGCYLLGAMATRTGRREDGGRRGWLALPLPARRDTRRPQQ